MKDLAPFSGTPTREIGIGLFGTNGHQLQPKVIDAASGRLLAVAEFPDEKIPSKHPEPIRCEGLDELLTIPEVELVVLCSPVRAQQAGQAIRCLEAGKHVLAEKPCAMTETDLEKILETSRQTGKNFHEMAGSAFEQPYASLFALVQRGAIGRVRQIFAQKSYPAHSGRPADTATDGGLFLQAGIHPARWIDHGLKTEILGGRGRVLCHREGAQIAASAVLEIGDYATAVLVVNYFNPRGFGSWGNDCLRVWGEEGFLEISDGGSRSCWVEGTNHRGTIPLDPHTGCNWFDRVIAEIRDEKPMPITLEKELRPLRGLLRCELQKSFMR